jgi:predicted phosphodiesterase
MKYGKRILFIGDIHGVTDWSEIAINGIKQFYEIVFLGDYVDSFFVKPVEQLDNLKNLCTFIRKNKKQVTALIGNHDYAYMYGKTGISGHQHYHIQEYRKIFDDNKDLFQIAWGYTNPETQKYTLATHAGLTLTYWNNYIKPELKEGGFIYQFTNGVDIPIHEALNYMQAKEIMWKVGSMRGGMGTPGPIWADYLEVIEDRYAGINQVFGHTPQPTVRLDMFDEDIIACIDSWGNKKASSLLLTL